MEDGLAGFVVDCFNAHYEYVVYRVTGLVEMGCVGENFMIG